jgi:inhibitor of cysteine peptidase
MPKLPRIAASLAFLAVLVFGTATMGAQGEKTVTITDQDQDKDKEPKVELKKGDKLVVKLAANPTTGFTWVIASKEDDKLKSEGKPKYEPKDNQKKVAGGGGVQVFTFTAAEVGELDVEMHYLRTFEKDKEPAKKFKFKVTIK